MFIFIEVHHSVLRSSSLHVGRLYYKIAFLPKVRFHTLDIDALYRREQNSAALSLSKYDIKSSFFVSEYHQSCLDEVSSVFLLLF